MFKTLPLLLLLAVAHCQMGKNADVDSSVLGIFGLPPKNLTESSLVDKTRPSTIVPPINTNIGDAKDLSCTMDDGQIGECVNYYLCDKNNTIIDDGAGVIDIRVGWGPCGSYLVWCCLPRHVRPPDNPITPQPQPPKKGCGWRNPKGVDMRTTGETNGETKFGEFPWMVVILKIIPVNKNEPDGQKSKIYEGGGSLIAPNVVLSAAHHVASSSTLRIRAGEWDTQCTEEIYPFQERDVTSVEIHKDFSGGGNLFYDVALLFLSKPVVLAPNVGVVCLPPPRQRTPAGTKCFATGWGKDKFGMEGRYPVIMKKIEVPVVERNACQTALRKTRLGRSFELHTSFMCAGGEEGKDTCSGDGGSPLSCPMPYEEERYMQSGIVAWGIGCGEDGTPGVYVDVSFVRDWIDDKIIGKGLDSRINSV